MGPRRLRQGQFSFFTPFLRAQAPPPPSGSSDAELVLSVRGFVLDLSMAHADWDDVGCFGGG